MLLALLRKNPRVVEPRVLLSVKINDDWESTVGDFNEYTEFDILTTRASKLPEVIFFGGYGGLLGKPKHLKITKVNEVKIKFLEGYRSSLERTPTGRITSKTTDGIWMDYITYLPQQVDIDTRALLMVQGRFGVYDPAVWDAVYKYINEYYDEKIQTTE